MHGQALNAVRLPFSPPEGERMPKGDGPLVAVRPRRFTLSAVPGLRVDGTLKKCRLNATGFNLTEATRDHPGNKLPEWG